jgi:hypothetical protein
LLSTGEGAERDFEPSERSEFSKSRQLRGAQGSPQDQQRALSFGSFSLMVRQKVIKGDG